MTGLRFRRLSDELRKKFGCRVQRIAIDAGFTCPNRDGSKGLGGCIFCSDRGSGSEGIEREKSVREQIADGKKYMKRRYNAKKFIAYFQSFSNTYAPAEILHKIYSEALEDPDVVCLMAGTRPDCIDIEKADFLSELSRRTWLWVELGLQSSHDRTLERINRGHTAEDFRGAAELLKSRGIMVCAHVILGLPGETDSDMMKTAKFLNSCGVDGVKIHHLHILKNTKIAQDYAKGEIRTLSVQEYVRLAADFLERLSPETIIHRVVGDGGSHLIAPVWSEDSNGVINLINEELERRGSKQGSKFSQN